MNKSEFQEALANGKLKLVKQGVREFGVNADLTNYIPFTSNPSSLYEAHHWEYRPLHWAVQGNQLKVIDYLIENGANINLGNKVGNTPLHLAIYLGRTESALLLLEYKASLTIKNKKVTHTTFWGIGPTFKLSPEEGCTPLHYAAQWGDINVIGKMLSHIANFEILNDAAFIDKYGRYEQILQAKTPLQLARKRRLEPNMDKDENEIGVQIND
ncbi:MAG: ankyrin repeat domain-containing protein, partial [Gammaproteobacteria bacterium]|nr:ankyrin repeat domain-containing protein [Gammaproteobacteria bacterium]